MTHNRPNLKKPVILVVMTSVWELSCHRAYLSGAVFVTD